MELILGLLIGMALAFALVAAKARYAGFRAQTPAEFAARGPAFDMRKHLSGPILCEGMIYGPTGRVTSRFVAEMHGNWQGNVCTLTEVFRYDNGTVQNRAWTLRLGEDGSIRAEAPDLVGAGTGTVSGPAVQMKYRLKLDEAAGGHVVSVVDWMYLMENGTIMNRSQFSKFGLPVAELVATMRRLPG